MTTCKQPKSQEDLTPHPPHQGSGSLLGKGGQEGKMRQDPSVILVPSPLRKRLGNSYLYLLQKSVPAKSSGFTIIECLLAIIMVSIMLTAVAPVIVLSVATRVQARRVEQASMAARTYIDGVQTGTIPAPKQTLPLAVNAPTPASTLPTCSKVDDRSTNPDSIFPYCQNDATVSLYCVDNGGDCVGGNTKDFVVQAFRGALDPTIDPNNDGSKGYLLGVRVYRADGFDGLTTLTTTKARQQNQQPSKIATNTGGRGQRNAPMIELTTEIRPGVQPVNLTPPVPGVSPSPTSSASPGSAMKSLCARLGGCVDTTPPPL